MIYSHHGRMCRINQCDGHGKPVILSKDEHYGLYVGSSLLAPLKNAEREINRVHNLDLRVAAYNFGSPLSDREWHEVEHDLDSKRMLFSSFT